MEIVSREEFANMMAPFIRDTPKGRNPLWIPEMTDGKKKITCIKFLRTKPIKRWETTKPDYWAWCHEVLNGEVRCFSSGDEDEWWGFTDPDDIVIWTLKWAK